MRVRPLLAPAVAAVVLAAVVAAPSAAQTTGVRHWLGDVGVVATPASFSELSFVEHDRLPSTVDIFGNTKFSFVATNVAAAGSVAKAYTWSVSVGAVGHESMVAHGQFSLPANGSLTIPVQFRIADCHQRNEISVALHGPDSREPALHYWVVEHGSAQWRASGGPSCGV